MIYWILHKPLTKSDYSNPIEGAPCFFYEKFNNFAFIDISSFSLFAKIENTLLKIQKTNTNELKINPAKYLFVNNKKDFYKQANKDGIFVFQAFNNPRAKQFYKLLAKENKTTILMNHYQLPISTKFKRNRDASFIKHILSFDKKIIFLRFLYRLYNLDKHFSFDFDFAFLGGKKTVEDLKKANVFVKQIVPVHSVSYDEYLAIKTDTHTVFLSEPYFVFVDQTLTVHPDNRGFSESDTQKYHDEVIGTLRQISSQNANIKIVIAQHPRCQYPKGFWEDFECFDGKTAELINGAQCVIGHFSTALCLSFFYKKPLVFLKSSSEYFPFNKNVENACDFLGGTMIDMCTQSLCIEKPSHNFDLTDYFTLRPDTTKSNKILFSDFFEKYNGH